MNKTTAEPIEQQPVHHSSTLIINPKH